MAQTALAAFVVGTALLLVGTVARAQTDYADAGTHTYSTTAIDSGTAGSAGGSLVLPNDPGPFPLLIASHGWSASSAQQLGWAQHFASWGFVVAAPTFPNTLRPDANVDQAIIVQLVALYGRATTDSPAKGKVDPARIGLEGHSAGGLASTLAARALGPGAVVLFDPVDSADAGATAYADLCSPLLGIFASPSSCNDEEEWSTFATDTTASLVSFRVVGSSHCDGENPDRGAACGLVCGGSADATRQSIYARYATAFFLANLKGDPGAAALFDPAALGADPGIADAGVRASHGCGADGGSAPPGAAGDGGATAGRDGGGSPGAPPAGGGSGGGSDGGPPSGPGSSGDDGGTATVGGGNGSAPGGAGGGGSGCGCSAAGAGRSGSAGAIAALLAAAIAALSAGRRRQARG